MTPPARSSRIVVVRLGALLLGLALGACDDPAVLTVDMPLHLEDHLDGATIVGSEVPANPAPTVEWRFDEPQPEWRPTPSWNPPYGTPELTQTGEGLRVTLTDRTRVPQGVLRGVMHVGLQDWDRGDWADVVIRARADSAAPSTSSVSSRKPWKGCTAGRCTHTRRAR